MGTRNLTVVIKDGNVRVAKYCQWDGYPSGQGVAILEFLRDNYDPVLFDANLAKSRVVTAEEADELWQDAGADPGAEMVSFDIGAKMCEIHPSLTRDMGGDILAYIQNNEGVPHQLDYDFGFNSLFCEWAYLLNLDTNQLEVYKGFNTHMLEPGERWYSKEHGNHGISDKYYGVKLIKKYDLLDLPSNEDFVEEIDAIAENFDETSEVNTVINELAKQFDKDESRVGNVFTDSIVFNAIIANLRVNIDDIVACIHEERNEE